MIENVDASSIEAFVGLIAAIIAAVYGVIQKVKTMFADTKAEEANAARAAAEAAADESYKNAEKSKSEASQAQADLKTYNDLMDPTIPQTEEQTALIDSGKVADAAWTMTINAKDELHRKLTDAGAVITKDGLYAAVETAEGRYEVEYAIRCHDFKKDSSLMNDPAAFISYGQVLEVASWERIKELIAEHKVTCVVTAF